MTAKNWRISFGLLAAYCLAASPALAGDPVRLNGSLVGFVSNSTGVAQMGATVLLYNRADRLVGRALTNEKGAFGFENLSPDNYSLRVTLASFVPAFKQGILVQPGMRSFLAINLAGVLSSIELVYSAPGQASLMSDDWKWVLRSSVATRSVLRIRPAKIEINDPNERPADKSASSAFSATRGVVKVSAGDQGASSSLGNETDLGTAFALATSVFGANRIQVTGNLGYGSNAGSPAAGFSTRFSRTDLGVVSPEVQLTMRQVYLPTRAGAAFIGKNNGPALRTMSATVQDRLQVSDNLLLEYGATLESVSFLERLNFFSPFARATYDLGKSTSLQVAYNSGAPPLDFLTSKQGAEARLQQDLHALALFPRVSLRDGHARVQRSDNVEVGVKRTAGRRTFAASVFQENVSNAALLMSGAEGIVAPSDSLPDIGSRSSIFNIGSYRSRGFMASVSEEIGDTFSVALAYGMGGVLRTEQRDIQNASPDDVRQLVRAAQRQWASARLSGTAPVIGTRFTASYLWTDYRSLTPVHTYLTQSYGPLAGLNVSVRQPIPQPSGMPGRLEASAEFRNLMAQGYLPLSSDTRRVLLIQSPRAVRGGLSFIF
ncbi:MAG: TonB-dependent receptor [Bryobacteraceae bacterium]|nr:TonB-dependent receptor [Bryobacteraceae bacterium]